MNQFVVAARKYIGVPYAHQGRSRERGLDCIGLVVCVAQDLGVMPAGADRSGYGRQPSGALLQSALSEHMQKIERPQMMPGDVVCVAFDKFPQHVGVLGNYAYGGLSIIHANAKRGKVIETRLLFSDAMKFVAAFRWKGF
jgi:cell wall-associated NlpC family hydrolase